MSSVQAVYFSVRTVSRLAFLHGKCSYICVCYFVCYEGEFFLTMSHMECLGSLFICLAHTQRTSVPVYMFQSELAC